MSVVTTERSGSVTTLTIDRPEAFNALNADVIGALLASMSDAAADRSTRAVIVTGSGKKAFSAGADLKELAGMTPDTARRTMTDGQRAFRLIEQLPIPVIAAVNGLALGGGFELALTATFPVLSTSASLGLPESGLGLIPGYGGTQRLPRAIGERTAAYMMLTGARLSAARAFELGLTPIPPTSPDDLLPTALDLAEKIAAQGPDAVRSILSAVGAGRDSTLDAGLAIETGLAALAVAGDESTEGIGAFLERRPARFDNPEA
ncbi:enoyl-CoA hydratase/isomerase family protein [Rhodococcus sp. NPDC057297]|jgi:enoyl-CoA hydratase|uniref:enoyl-CoA hydratase/isomerase family protein n=1 Tax=Rhodococcus sp. NPDC057297 TaxID=3346090 RepID=UPI00362943DB